MGQPTRIILPIAELRFQMGIVLAVFPRSKLGILARPHDPLKEATRRELIATLTEGWDGWHIERAIADEEQANLAALLSMGRIALPDDKPR
jgi:hypothetical protein